MDIKPVYGEPAALIQDTLIIADLHIGFESELRKNGVEVPSTTPRKKNRLTRLLEKTKPKKLIIAGDLKHNIPQTSRQEHQEIPRLLKQLNRKTKVTIIPGNHDGNLSKVLPQNIETATPRGILIKNIGIIHGHCHPSPKIKNAKTLLTAHTHPSIVLTEKNGAKTIKRAWIKFSDKNQRQEKIIMPAFNEMAQGTDIKKEGPLGPIQYNGTPTATLLDGTRLGPLKNIQTTLQKPNKK